MPAKRLSTAFDSVTLYGEDPHERPDIYGKVGNSGVSAGDIGRRQETLFGLRSLGSNGTSVSMTINGPAPMILAFFMNTAIDQACESYITENDLWGEVRAEESARSMGIELGCVDTTGDRPIEVMTDWG